MKKWNTPELSTLDIAATAAPKPAGAGCPGYLQNGTCTYWCNGKPFGPCDYHPGNKCRLKKGETSEDPDELS